jgi:uncharacterized damage-inducible protein DinB
MIGCSGLPAWQNNVLHRGQVTMMLRQLGTKPIGTDLILFYWDRER